MFVNNIQKGDKKVKSWLLVFGHVEGWYRENWN
jgi:hypothetical protein